MKLKVKKKARGGKVLLGQTRSVCPVCLLPITAHYTGHGDGVFFEKNCPEHGAFSVQVWQGISSFLKWRGKTICPPEIRESGNRGCPYECGLCQSHLKDTCCVLLEVTNRCNLRCPVCFASSGSGSECEDPGLSEISDWYDMLINNGGPFNIQLSGGEPSLRSDLPDIINLGKEKGFSFFQLNTNGIRIADDPSFIGELAVAGLSTVFLQFDGLNKSSTVTLRGADLLEKKLKAIENCSMAGVGVVLVPTIVSGVNDSELGSILSFAAEHMPTVRGVHFQPVSLFGRCSAAGANGRITIPELLSLLESQAGGAILASDFSPAGAEHPLCSFHADYLVESGTWTLQKSSGDSCCCGERVSSSQARDAVARKWSRTAVLPASNKQWKMFDLSELDRFLTEKCEKTLAISGMAFQDAWNLDINRLRQCYIHVVVTGGRLIPFCAYNLTSINGTALYRGK